MRNETHKYLAERFCLGTMIFARCYGRKKLPQPLLQKREIAPPLIEEGKGGFDGASDRSGTLYFTFPDYVLDTENHIDLAYNRLKALATFEVAHNSCATALPGRCELIQGLITRCW